MQIDLDLADTAVSVDQAAEIDGCKAILLGREAVRRVETRKMPYLITQMELGQSRDCCGKFGRALMRRLYRAHVHFRNPPEMSRNQRAHPCKCD